MRERNLIATPKYTETHTSGMKTRDLLRELLHRSNLKAAGLAERLKDEGVTQPQLSRFLGEKTREPKRSTLAPVADYYGISVDAFFDEDLAERLLAQIDRGEFAVQPRHSRGRSVAPTPPQPAATSAPSCRSSDAPDGVGQTIEKLGELLKQASDQNRSAVAQLLLQYAQNPTEGTQIAQAIELLLKSKDDDPKLQ